MLLWVDPRGEARQRLGRAIDGSLPQLHLERCPRTVTTLDDGVRFEIGAVWIVEHGCVQRLGVDPKVSNDQ